MRFIRWFLSLFKKDTKISELKKQSSHEVIIEPEIVQKKPKEISITELIKNEQNRTKKRKEFQKEGNKYILNVLGLDFIFCPYSWKKFNEEFKSNGWEIDYDINEGYILRRSVSKKEYFHIWLMEEKIEEFLDRRRCTRDNVEVHHRNHCRRDNSLNNLVVLSKVEHKEHHKKEKAFKKWVGTREAFEDWWFRNHKEEKDPTLSSMANQKLT